MGALQCLPHDVHVPDALEGVVRPTSGEIHQIRHEILHDLVRVDEVGHAELLGEWLLVRVDVHADYPVRPDHAAALMTLSPIPPSPKITTLDPTSTFAVFTTAPMPVVTPQPM